MSENKSRRVMVEARTDDNVVVANFRSKATMRLGRNCHVCVELTEEELQLQGESFIQAARNALQRTVFGNEQEVMLYTNNGIKQNAPTTQILGRRISPDAIVLTDRWKPLDTADDYSPENS